MGEHRRRRAGLPDRLWRWFAVERNRQCTALVAIVGLIAGAVAGLVLVGGSSSQRTALPPTPPSPRPASIGASAGPGRSTPLPTHIGTKKPARRHAIKCSRPHAAGGETPARICIPAIGVDASVMSLGLNADRTVQVPPLSEVGEAGWYHYSKVPGDAGPSVILGHIDSAQYGKGVFYDLGKLTAGDRVMITRGDGRLAIFRVNSVVEVAKSRFPSDAVYGPTSGPALRLVTCGGPFDASTGNYLDNIIAYGTLLDLRRG